MKSGEKLKNGATILHFRQLYEKRVVLAEWDRNRSEPHFVTWRVDEVGNAYWGHYFHSLEEATQDFYNR